MALKRMVLQIGMGTDIRGRDYTKAAVRALRDALWRNALSIANALGLSAEAMQVAVTIGVPEPERGGAGGPAARHRHGAGRQGRARNSERGRHRCDGARPCRRGGAARNPLKEAIMPATRVILELGSGTDLHGGDYTKAAVRAVEDAIRHSSLSFLRT